MVKALLLIAFPFMLFAQAADEAAIRKASRKFSEDYIKGDFQAMADAYTDNALVMAPSRDAIVGKDAILAFWKTTTVPVTHESVPEKITVEGNVAHDYGYFYVQAKNPEGQPAAVNSAKYYIRWEKGQDGQWRMAVDMWNSRKTGWVR